MHTVKVTTIGDSIGIVFPPEISQHLRVADGDELQVSETLNGVELTACNEIPARQLEFAKRVMIEDREVLRRLAD
jgi:putative addiction module antidote